MKLDIARKTALESLYDIDKNKAYIQNSLDKHIRRAHMDMRDKSLATEIVYGVTRWKLLLDNTIESYSKIKLNKLSTFIHNILRIGLYQLFFMDKIPDSASVNESVNLAKRYGHNSSSRFVNAVLRSAQREGLKQIDKETINTDKYLSITYSHPLWLVKRWTQRWGVEFTQSLLNANNMQKGVMVRINSSLVSRDELIEALGEKGISTEKGKYFDDSLLLKNPSGIGSIEEFKKGFFQVQDEAAMLAVKVLDPKPNEFILDMCAAPGGKTTHISHLMNGTGKVLASDIHENKLDLINENCMRLGIENVITRVHDASKVDYDNKLKADRVLIDAPCSGFGTIRHKPDIKWARTPEDILEISKIQYSILCASSQCVKPGGYLVYSTCTTEYEENEQVVFEFLKQYKDFKICDIKDNVPDELKGAISSDGFLSVYPHTNDIDAFFIAKLTRVI